MKIKPPTFLPKRLHADFLELYRGFRAKGGGRETVSGAYWMAVHWYTNPLPHLGPKTEFDLKSYQGDSQ